MFHHEGGQCRVEILQNLTGLGVHVGACGCVHEGGKCRVEVLRNLTGMKGNREMEVVGEEEI